MHPLIKLIYIGKLINHNKLFYKPLGEGVYCIDIESHSINQDGYDEVIISSVIISQTYITLVS